MSKVFGMHTITLHPGVKAEEFERFVLEEVSLVFTNAKLLKGDRGEKEGTYLAMFEMASVEARDQLYPAPGEMSEEAQQFFATHAALVEKWETFATPLSVIYTDYVVVDK